MSPAADTLNILLNGARLGYIFLYLQVSFIMSLPVGTSVQWEVATTLRIQHAYLKGNL